MPQVELLRGPCVRILNPLRRHLLAAPSHLVDPNKIVRRLFGRDDGDDGGPFLQVITPKPLAGQRRPAGPARCQRQKPQASAAG